MPADASARRARLWRLASVVLISGAATMSLQMCAVRLIAPWTGASSLVWASVIGLSLLAMALGYAIGGRLADRRGDGRGLARTLLGAAVLVLMVPMVAPVVLPHVQLGITNAAAGSMVGSAVAYLVLIFLPALLLGVTPPYAIRLAIERVDHSGLVAGRLYAISTVGSIIGTLGAALVLLQAVGTRATLLATAASLLVAAAIANGAQSTADVDAPADRTTPTPAVEDGAPTAARAVISLRAASLIALVEGAAMMTVEMGAARLVAPFFGASQAVWAVLIAIIMGCIAVGSAVGGRAADRRPTIGALVTVLAAAALTIAVLPFVATPVMRVSAGGIDAVAIGTVVGTFLATMALLIVPVVLLGAVPPWLLRLAVPSVARTGHTAGRLYALSTTGALAGTLMSVLVLIPAIGTRRTLLAAAITLAIAACLLVHEIAGPVTARVRGVAAAALVVSLALLAAPTGLIKPVTGAHVLTEHESRYQFIQASEQPSGIRQLQINEGWAVHSIYDPRSVITGMYWDDFLALPALLARPARSLAMIGNAAGTVPRTYRTTHPGVRVDGVEIDPQVTDVGNSYFHMRGKNLRMFTADGRDFLRNAGDRRYDMIFVDAYRQPYIPFHLTTREFFTLARDHVSPGGLVAINIGSAPGDRRIDESIIATMQSVFPVVMSHRSGPYNQTVIGMRNARVSTAELRSRLRAAASAPPDARARDRNVLPDLYASFADGLARPRAAHARALTDDRAPVEWMTDHMIFSAAQAG